jgi:hypothetical protein
MLEGNFTSLFTKLLESYYNNDQAALAITQSLRKLVPFKKAREEAQKVNLPEILCKTISKHQQGNLTIIQYSFMCLGIFFFFFFVILFYFFIFFRCYFFFLVILATSSECRDTCRKTNSIQVFFFFFFE